MTTEENDPIEVMLAEAIVIHEVRQEALLAIRLSNGIGNLLDKYMENGDWSAFKAGVVQKVQVCFDQKREI